MFRTILKVAVVVGTFVARHFLKTLVIGGVTYFFRGEIKGFFKGIIDKRQLHRKIRRYLHDQGIEIESLEYNDKNKLYDYVGKRNDEKVMGVVINKDGDLVDYDRRIEDTL